MIILNLINMLLNFHVHKEHRKYKGLFTWMYTDSKGKTIKMNMSTKLLLDIHENEKVIIQFQI